MLKPKKSRASGKRKISNTIFRARPDYVIVCPGCGKALPREFDFCRSCGIMFIFLDETNRFCG